MDLISTTLHYIGKNYKNISVIQIGAMDGIQFDNTRGFLDMYKWDSLLIEPIPEIFQQLKNNFQDRSNYTFEQCAVAEHDGTVKMLTIPQSAIVEQDLHPGYKGMSAIYPLKNGFGSDYQRDIEVKSKFGVDIEVPCLTLDSLFEKHNVDTFDILICDAEGYDWNIFKQLDLTKYKPKFIRLEYINLTTEEKQLTLQKLKDYGYYYEINQDVDAVITELWNTISENNKKESSNESSFKYCINDVKSQLKNISLDDKKQLMEYLSKPVMEIKNNNLTIVSGLWNIGRGERDFEEHYIPRFKEFLKTPANLILLLPKELHSMVWEVRDPSNTHIRHYELQDVKNIYEPHWEATQKIRNSKEWLDLTGEGGWLRNSPQAKNQWYNPIVQSKMFMLHDASLWNPFNTEYFYWIDAGITNTVPTGHLVEENILDKLTDFSNPFLFLSYPYEAADEIHGFCIKAMNRYAGHKVDYVCRGGLFGGHKEQIKDANSTYYALLQKTLSQGYMGTEESIFTIMSYNQPNLYRRYMLDENGLVVKFTQAVIDNNVLLEQAPNPTKINTTKQMRDVKTNLYILTFNFPEQLLHTINSMKKVPEWLQKPHLVLLDNSTNEEAKQQNKNIADEYNFEYISLKGNTGICGGRQFAAEHFDQSDADYYFFFEDDMTSNCSEEEGKFCRNGFRKFIPNLYELAHKIIIKEDFDFLKLSFMEVYWDNNIQTSWYNVPQQIRTRDWPDYDKLPITGHDPNAPRTKFNNINIVDGLAYIDGEVTYTNWPMIVSREGNKKMFINTKWAHPFEQTWMSHMYQLTKKGELRPAVLLASPIWHDRIKHYPAHERREN